MHRQKTSSPAIFLSFLICTSCTSYEISPQIDNNTPAATGQEISNFTYSITSPWENTRFGKSAYEATALMLPRTKDISNTATDRVPGSGVTEVYPKRRQA